jgi:FMN-dependent NADH-azoreductase
MGILHIDASARYQSSVTRQLSAFFIDMLLETGTESYQYLDLASNPPPTITELHNVAMYTPETERDAKMRAALKTSDDYVDQLLAADTIVIAAPMYNFGIPASLKAYFDMIIRLGRTFIPDNSGNYVGQLANKKVIVIASFGADYRKGAPMEDMNCYEPHLRHMLSFIGATDPQFVIAQPTQFGGVDEKEASIAEAQDKLRYLAEYA